MEWAFIVAGVFALYVLCGFVVYHALNGTLTRDGRRASRRLRAERARKPYPTEFP